MPFGEVSSTFAWRRAHLAQELEELPPPALHVRGANGLRHRSHLADRRAVPASARDGAPTAEDPSDPAFCGSEPSNSRTLDTCSPRPSSAQSGASSPNCRQYIPYNRRQGPLQFGLAPNHTSIMPLSDTVRSGCSLEVPSGLTYTALLASRARARLQVMSADLSPPPNGASLQVVGKWRSEPSLALRGGSARSRQRR